MLFDLPFPAAVTMIFSSLSLVTFHSSLLSNSLPPRGKVATVPLLPLSTILFRRALQNYQSRHSGQAQRNPEFGIIKGPWIPAMGFF
jgi:hypothetical protein